MQSKKLTQYIFIAMVLGILCGWAFNHQFAGTDVAQEFSDYISILTDVFLRLIKMIIAPLVFSTLVVGIARMGDGGTIGRVGVKTFGWFLFMTLLSLTLGIIMVTLLQPGVNLHLSLPAKDAATGIAHHSMSLQDFVSHMIPTSVVDAMARNEILQIVVFAVFFGVAAAHLGKKGEPLVDNLDMIAHIMLKVTTFIMNLAPLAVFAAIAAVVAKNGLGILVDLWLVHAELLPRHSCLVVCHHRDGIPVPPRPRIWLGQERQGTDPVGVHHGELRGGLSQDTGTARAFWLQQPDCILCLAGGILVQS